MIRGLRNLFIGASATIAAVLLAGLAQGALEIALPDVSQRMLGSTDVSTCFVLSATGLLFFAAGLFVPRWLLGSLALFWLLLPLAGLYSVARLMFPQIYGCTPGAISGCWMAQLPFIVAACGLVMGYGVRRLGTRSRHVV